MERSDNSDRMDICRDICCSLLMLFLGLFFCFPLATLTYFTYQTIDGSRQFCTLWIDVPGRIVILLIFYYIASICGFLPLPRRYHLHSFIVPFNIWRLRSWRRLFRNMCVTIPSRTLIMRLRRNVTSIQENLETPLLQENNQERFYTCSPRRRHTTPINIPYPETYNSRVSIFNPETTPRNETPEIIRSSNGSITSIDPSFGDIVLPIMPEKSSKRHYISEATIKESESPNERDGVPSKYRKRFTDIKFPGEAAGNVLAPPPYYQITRERPVMLTSDKKSRALTDDERLAISRRQERRILGSKMPEMHIKNDIESVPDAKTPATDPPVASERSLDDKYFDLTDEERLVTTREQALLTSRNERPKVDTIDDGLEVLVRNELLPETNDRPGVHKRNLHPEGAAACSNKSEALPEYHNTEAQLNFSGTRNRNHQPQGLETDSVVARKQPLEDKYFEVTDDKSLVSTRQKEFQVSENERPKVHPTDDRLEVLARNELLPETNDQLTVHKRNLYPGEAYCSNQQGAPSECRSTEAQLKFSGAHNRNQQPRGRSVNNEQEIPSKFHSTEAQMNFSRTLGRNEQPDRETASSERERVVRTRNNRTSLNFPLFPWIVHRNSKGLSARSKELRKKNLEFVKHEIERYPETRNRRQVHFDRSLVRSVLRNLRSQSVIQTQLPRSHENINLLASSSFPTENSSSGSAKSSDKRIEVKPNTSSDVSEGNVGLTTNRYDATQKQGRISMSFCQAMNLSRSLVDRATRRRRQFPSLRFQVYARTRSQIQEKTEVKRIVKLEKCTPSDKKDSEHIMTDVAGPSNLSKFEGDTKRTGMVKPVTQETAKESFNRSQLDELRKKLTLVDQSKTHLNIEASAAVEYKQSICTKITDKNPEDIGESNASTKPSEAHAAKKPYVKIIIDSPLITSESDSDSDPEQSK